jgi:antitoxin HicB
MEAEMDRFTYKALIEPGDADGTIVVTFPDLPLVATDGAGRDEALANAAEALGLMLLALATDGERLPASKSARGIPVTPQAEVVAKLLLIEAFRESGLTRSEYARRLRRDPKIVRRLLDPMHATPIAQLEEALRVLGRRLVIGTRKFAA